MAQALSQLLFGMFDTQNYFVKLGFCLFSGKIWETRSGEIYILMGKQIIPCAQQGQRQYFVVYLLEKYIL